MCEMHVKFLKNDVMTWEFSVSHVMSHIYQVNYYT